MVGCGHGVRGPRGRSVLGAARAISTAGAAEPGSAHPARGRPARSQVRRSRGRRRAPQRGRRTIEQHRRFGRFRRARVPLAVAARARPADIRAAGS